MPTVRTNQDELKNEIATNHAEIKALLEELRNCTCQELDELTRTHPDGSGNDTSILGRKILSSDDLDDNIGYGDGGQTPPDGSSSWSEYDQKHCVTAYQIVWMMEQVIEMWIERYEAGILFSLTAATLGIVNIFGEVLKLSFRAAAGISLAKNSSQFLIPLSVVLALWDDLKEMLLKISTANIRSDFQNMKGSLICAIYCGKSPKQVGEKFNQAVDDSGANMLVKNVVRHLMWPELKNWVSKKGSDYEPPDFPGANCTGCDCMGEWHDPYLMVHTAHTLRDMVLSGSDIVQWNNSGRLGGHFAPLGSPTFDGDAVKIDYSPYGIMYISSFRCSALYMVVEFLAADAYDRLALSSDGQDTVKNWVEIENSGTSLRLTLRGGDSITTPYPGGRMLVGQRADGTTTRYSINGVDVGSNSPSGSPGVIGHLRLGSYGTKHARAKVWAVVMWEHTAPITQEQEDDIIQNLTNLYGPWG